MALNASNGNNLEQLALKGLKWLNISALCVWSVACLKCFVATA